MPAAQVGRTYLTRRRLPAPADASAPNIAAIFEGSRSGPLVATLQFFARMSIQRGPGTVAPIARAPVQIVYTPGSGEGRATALARRMARELRRHGERVRLAPFKRLGDLAAWSSSCAGDFSRLIAIGGDATQSAAAPAAMRHGVPLFPVPTGFGNL